MWSAILRAYRFVDDVMTQPETRPNFHRGFWSAWIALFLWALFGGMFANPNIDPWDSPLVFIIGSGALLYTLFGIGFLSAAFAHRWRK